MKKFLSKSNFLKTFCILILILFNMRNVNAANPPANLSIKINTIDNISPDFIKGADVSMLNQIEKSGGKFFDTDGKEKDCLEILKNHGVNYIRLRLWNNPVFTQAMIDSRKISGVKPGDPVGGGNCDLAMVKKISKRAKALGMKIQLDFHYSDFWADPISQDTPTAWKKMNAKQLSDAIYNYTKSVLTELKNENIAPDMVQIGNEIKNGICFPVGKNPDKKADFFNLLKSGSKAVREVLTKSVPIIIHLPDGGSNFDTRYFLDYCFIDYDVIGLSYYPFWDKPVEELIKNLNDVSAKYKKKVLVLETAYGYTTENGDNQSNLFSAGDVGRGGYKATVQGQATAMRDVMAAVAQVPNGKGLGVFYWEPDWIPVEGAGWVTGQGNNWDNMTWWDKNGKPLDSIWTYSIVSGPKKSYKFNLESISDIDVSTSANIAPILPAVVYGWFNNDGRSPVEVEWNKIDPKEYAKGGAKFAVEGKVKNSDLKAKANVSVSLLKNPGFELGSPEGWLVEGSGIKDQMETKAGNVRTGNFALGFWAPAGFKFKVSQTITGIAPGKYIVSAWAEGGGGEYEYYFFATSGAMTKKQDVKDTVWAEWHKYSVEIVVDASGTLTFGMSCNAAGGNWGTFDDFELTPIK